MIFIQMKNQILIFTIETKIFFWYDDSQNCPKYSNFVFLKYQLRVMNMIGQTVKP